MSTTLLISITIIIGMIAMVLHAWIKHRGIFNAYKATMTGFNEDVINALATRQDNDEHQRKYFSALLYFFATQILQRTIRFGGNRDQRHKIAYFLYQLSDAMSGFELSAANFGVIGYQQALFIQRHPNVAIYILYRFFSEGTADGFQAFCADAIKDYKEDRFLEFNQRHANSVLRRFFVHEAQPKYSVL